MNFNEIKLFISDIDGVWTDGSIYIGTNGMEFKQFTVLDGVGVAAARAAEIKIALISARFSPATEHRAKDLQIDDVYNGGLNKLPAFEDLKSKYYNDLISLIHNIIKGGKFYRIRIAK